ncbi:MAG TPA: hypothetical protein VFQ58_06335, partial [Flavisolibacter sp.]|nr:hypothetical protein [Flavisolibacter sp.]
MEEQLSPQDSIILIRSMINKTKTNIAENSFYFLFWGWFAFIAILTQFFMKVVLHSPYNYIVWALTIPAVIFTIGYSYQKRKKRSVHTYIGENMGSLWTGIGITFFILCFIITQSRESWFYAYPYFIMIYGLGTFVSGRIIRFKPLVIGGILNWILACASTFFIFDYQLLFAAVALLTSYIIPGHLLLRQKG